ncbi:hypothetical protein EQW76_00830 [Rhizobium sp. rho-13.1]|uniref:hypothetical protein n=1 Tax=Rhizobium sp. rho-13.1 TaxID=2506431 RepID=UPI00115EA57A|nr:hypothetical protein [Rhizobium sp. rho-13.1]TQX91311.1 hypothetical protein EQW76_00830 [Rhizobium sp. rho-13.1]
MKVTNNSEALQGVHTLGGVAYILPGETREVDLNADQADRAAKLAFLTLEGNPVKGEVKSTLLNTVDVPDNEIDQLRQQLESSTADVSRLNSSLDDALAEITRHKGLVANRDKEIADLKGTSGEINDLKVLIGEREAEIKQLKDSLAVATQQQGTSQSQQTVTPVGPFEVRDTSAGWFGIFGADGNQVGKSIRSTDADAFRAMAPEGQLAYLTAPASV